MGPDIARILSGSMEFLEFGIKKNRNKKIYFFTFVAKEGRKKRKENHGREMSTYEELKASMEALKEKQKVLGQSIAQLKKERRPADEANAQLKDLKAQADAIAADLRARAPRRRRAARGVGLGLGLVWHAAAGPLDQRALRPRVDPHPGPFGLRRGG